MLILLENHKLSKVLLIFPFCFYLCMQASKPLLLAAKGTFLMVFMLDITEGYVSLVLKTHVCGNHAVSITGV